MSQGMASRHPGPVPPADDLTADPRLQMAAGLFNAGEWYACHDVLEEIWHETQGPDRAALQGFLQIAVAHLHLQRGNQRGATLLLGEGLGRLAPFPADALGFNLTLLRARVADRLHCLQQGNDPGALPLPVLRPAA